MSLQDVKVGDVVVVAEHFRPLRVYRAPVTVVGRKYITVDKKRFAKDCGWLNGESNIVTVHTVSQWERQGLDTMLRAAAVRLYNVRDFSVLTDDEVRDLTATLRAVAEKMEKAK